MSPFYPCSRGHLLLGSEHHAAAKPPVARQLVTTDSFPAIFNNSVTGANSQIETEPGTE
jgi:hypothetical protein